MPGNLNVPLADDVPHRWSLRFAPPVSQNDIRALIDRLGNFAELAQRGGFAKSMASCAMQVERHAVEDRYAFATAHVENCDERYARVLRYYLESNAVSLGIDIEEFTIYPETVGVPVVKLSSDAQEESVTSGKFYPSKIAAIDNIVRQARTDDFRSRHILFDLSVEPPADQINLIGHLVDTWANVALGAYPLSEEGFREGTEYMLNAQGSQHDELTYEVLVEEFFCAEAALNPIINIIGLELVRSNNLRLIRIE